MHSTEAPEVTRMLIPHEPWAAGDSRLILILSSERSGSTLLRVMLGEHSRILAPAELFLMRYPDYQTWRRLKSEAMHSIQEYFDLLGRPKSPADIDTVCREMDTEQVYEWLFSFLPPGSFLLDKTPAYANRMLSLTRSASFRPFYIWLIRHPLGVIDSHVRLKRKQLAGLRRLRRRINEQVEGLLNGGMSKLARERESKWVRQNRNVGRFLEAIPESRKHVIRFEHMVTDPRAALAALCAAMGLDFEPRLLTPHTRKRVMKPGIGDPNFDTHEKVDREPAFGWRDRLSEQSLSAETVALMREIGVAGA
jgi:hypothetical protein